MNTLIESKWRCDNCQDIHDSEDAALDCCPKEVSEIYICPHCSEAYNSLQEAAKCRDEHEEQQDFMPPPATAAELEAAGQARLLP